MFDYNFALVYVSPTFDNWLILSHRWIFTLTRKTPNTTIADFANTLDPDEMAHNELSHLDLQCLPSILWFFNIIYSLY